MVVSFAGDGDELVLQEPDTLKKRAFEFDRVYAPDSTQGTRRPADLRPR
jgi:hypothetical protein